MEFPQINLIHAVCVDNFLAGWNIGLANTLWSADCADLRAHQSGASSMIRDLPMDKLKRGELPSMFLQPRLMDIIINRNDRLWSLELSLEEARRKYSPDAPSRFSCLYIAEDTKETREWLSKMFGGSRALFKVKIQTCERIHKVDSAWIDHMSDKQNQADLAAYWQSVPFDKDNPKWEYLIDGFIEFTDPAEIESFDYGAKPSGEVGEAFDKLKEINDRIGQK